jgi:hypothetical protein
MRKQLDEQLIDWNGKTPGTEQHIDIRLLSLYLDESLIFFG